MFWKLFISIFKKKMNTHLRSVIVGDEIYIVDIHKFVSAEEEINQWKSALEKARTQN